MADFPNHFDPTVACMLDRLCERYEIPLTYCERSKAQAVIKHIWSAWCVEQGMNPDQVVNELDTHNKPATRVWNQLSQTPPHSLTQAGAAVWEVENAR